MIDFHSSFFYKSGVDEKSFLYDRDQVVMIGRSNAGKSSIINALCDNKKLMKVSKEAGRTRMMNYLDLGKKYYLVDAPGYGYATGRMFNELLSNYFQKARGRIKSVYWLIDPLRPLKDEDFELREMLEAYKLRYVILFAKVDKYKQKERQAAKKVASSIFQNELVIFTSSTSKEGLDTVRKDIEVSLTH